MVREPDPSLVREGLDLLELVATRLAKRLGGRIPLDDLRSIGNTAVADIVRSYEPGRSAFRTFASKRLRWALLDGLRRETHDRAAADRARALAALDRLGAAHDTQDTVADEPQTEEAWAARLRQMLESRAAARALGLVAGAVPARAPDSEVSPEEATSRVELLRVLRDAVARLPDRERQLIQRHYFGGENFDAVARELGISKSWASRLHAQAIAVLGAEVAGSPPPHVGEDAEGPSIAAARRRPSTRPGERGVPAASEVSDATGGTARARPR
jgi:RNA polymerase sigma factor for flagellar operon FliA